MKHTFLFMILVSTQPSIAMELTEPPSDTIVDVSSRLSRAAWKQEFATCVKKRDNERLIFLLSPEGKPAPTRSRLLMQGGLHISPTSDALSEIRTQKEDLLAVLNNTPPKDAKCCKHCNMTYVWNRTAAPLLIVLAQLLYIVSSGWSLQREFNDSLIHQQSNSTSITTPDYAQAALNAAPSIIGLTATVMGLPFSMSNAYGYLTLSNQQTQYQNLVLQEEMVETYKKIEALVEQNQAGIKTLLDRDRERGAARPPLEQAHWEQGKNPQGNLEEVDI